MNSENTNQKAESTSDQGVEYVVSEEYILLGVQHLLRNKASLDTLKRFLSGTIFNKKTVFGEKISDETMKKLTLMIFPQKRADTFTFYFLQLLNKDLCYKMLEEAVANRQMHLVRILSQYENTDEESSDEE